VFARWLRAFALTQIIEVPIYRRAFGCGFWEAFGASAITHPLVFWFNASHLWDVAWVWRATACELFAWWAEALYFALLHRRRSLRWALVANAASFSFGLGCWYFLGLT
jgi:hypothetical protein